MHASARRQKRADTPTLKMSVFCATALYKDPSATFDDLRTAVTMLEDANRIARRVLGGEHPLTRVIGAHLRDSRRVLARALAK